MSNMRIIVVILLFLAEYPKVNCQSIPIEIALGQRNIYSQFSISKQNKVNRIGFSNATSFMLIYQLPAKNELMSQSYINYNFKSNLKMGLGVFYSSKPGLKPSLNLQYTLFREHYSLIVCPRIDLIYKPTFDIMTSFEFKPKLNERMNLYSRVQLMYNFNIKHHNRSYEYFRIGIDKANKQFGFALNVDMYGVEYLKFINYGIFYKVAI